MLFGKIPFATLSQRHLVYAYCAVWLLQFGYATRPTPDRCPT
jgi:hypothetical protein